MLADLLLAVAENSVEARYFAAAFGNSLEAVDTAPDLEAVGIEPDLEVVGIVPDLEVVGIGPDLATVGFGCWDEVVGIEPDLEAVGIGPDLAAVGFGCWDEVVGRQQLGDAASSVENKLDLDAVVVPDEAVDIERCAG